MRPDAIDTDPISRRDFLKVAGVAASAAALPGMIPLPAAGAAPAAAQKTQRVLLIAFAGGVRSRETLGVPSNVPNLMKIAESGAVVPRVHTKNVGHYGASLSILTGTVEVKGIRENDRGENPTIFEYARKSLGLAADQVWFTASRGPQQRNFAYSTHGKYGAAYGANSIGSDGLFNQEFRDVLGAFGRPKVAKSKEEEALEKLRGSVGASPGADGLGNDAEARKRIERMILDEITKQTADLNGPGSEDGKAIRTAATLFRVFKPKLMAVHLANADIAHGSYNAYVEVIKRNDREVGKLWEAIQKDPELQATTTVFILPEFGRDADLNARNGLDHGDSSPELSQIALIAAGPDFKSKKTVETACDWIDVCPTACKLLGAKAEFSTGKPIQALFA